MQLCACYLPLEIVFISTGFCLISDYEALKYFNGQQHLNHRHGKWATYQFSFTLKYKPGALNKVADALSRRSLM
jgi:hypothetical protein